MKTEAIFFDKDGTLIDFDSFWVTVSQNAIDEISEKANMKHINKQELLNLLGITNGITNINSVICYGTYSQAAEVIFSYFKENGCNLSLKEVTEITVDAFHTNSKSGIIKPTCNNIKEVLTSLKNKGVYLAVVTTDDTDMTKLCLDKLEIAHFFDAIYTDDGNTPVKPDPYCIYHFCKSKNIPVSSTVMVGDTLNDMRFAAAAGIKAIGVAKKQDNKDILKPYAHTVLDDISYLEKVLD